MVKCNKWLSSVSYHGTAPSDTQLGESANAIPQHAMLIYAIPGGQMPSQVGGKWWRDAKPHLLVWSSMAPSLMNLPKASQKVS